ncbi:hypothetical protein [Pseudonocardia sp. GCM10023141]|uniref:hypothetical protein n=1 Tax=Pseudonocardia sp. GCM10023141 TaxID=3252653 RepID=UPI0036096518
MTTPRNATADSRPFFVLAAAGFLGGWILLRPIHGSFTPGLWWTLAHTVWLIGFVAFVPVGLALRRAAGPGRVGDLAAGVVVLSALANIVQMSLDLVAGAGAADAVDALRDIDWVDAVVYTVGAPLIFPAVAVLAARRAVSVPAASAVGIGVVMLAVGLLALGRNHPVTPAGMLVFGVGLVALTVRRQISGAHHVRSTSVAA